MTQELRSLCQRYLLVCDNLTTIEEKMAFLEAEQAETGRPAQELPLLRLQRRQVAHQLQSIKQKMQKELTISLTPPKAQKDS